MSSTALMSTYKRLPVSFERGEGAYLWDTQGRRYLDAFSGVAVCNLGHAHPAVTRAITEQAACLLHTSNHYGIPQQEALAGQLTRVSNMDKAFICNSGAEANEAAIKIARLHGHAQGIEVPTIIVADSSFHGRTLATLTATGNRRVQAGFEPLVKGFVRVPYNDIDAMRSVAEHSSNVVAVLIEPVQGEGGVHVPDADYLDQVRALCDRYGWLMILDEIQTGLCRTGAWFAFQHTGARPDIITVAKALGNGVPVGACLAQGKTADIFQYGNHGSTFGGNPLVCSAALAVIRVLEEEKLAARAAQLGERMLNGFAQTLHGNSQVLAVRGKGLMLGIELNRPCAELTHMALAQGLLINVTADKVIRLLPPLIISDAQADAIVTEVGSLIQDFAKAA